MADYIDPKPKTVRSAEPGLGQYDSGTPRPGVNITQSTASSTGAIVFLIAAIVLAVGAYFLYAGNSATIAPSVTQNITTVPAPAASTPTPAVAPATVPARPDPVTAPAAEKTAPIKPDATKPAQ